MAYQIVTRLCWVVPTLLAILLISFLLGKWAEVDTVEAQLSREGVRYQLSPTRYHDMYVELGEQSGAFKPLFYIDIVPQYQSSATVPIVPRRFYHHLRLINREVRDWEALELIAQAILGALRYYEQEDDKLIIGGINQLKNYDSLGAWQDYMKELHAKFRDHNIDAHTPLDQLHEMILGLQPKDRGWTWPTLRWNGHENQFHQYLLGIVTFDFGHSLIDGRSVGSKLSAALFWTLSITIPTLFLTVVLSLFFGVLLYRYEGQLWSRMVESFFYMIYALPLFWLATLMIVFFTTDEYGAWTNWFPTVGLSYGYEGQSMWKRLMTFGGQLVLPIFCVVLSRLAYLTRQVKVSLERVGRSPYVFAAFARGLPMRKVLGRHILPNAMLPIVTLITHSLPGLFVGSAIVEIIFNVPGTGVLMWQAIQVSDWPIVLVMIVLIGVLTILSYVLSDIINIIFFSHQFDTTN